MIHVHARVFIYLYSRLYLLLRSCFHAAAILKLTSQVNFNSLSSLASPFVRKG